jgi:hypothetical protein
MWHRPVGGGKGSEVGGITVVDSVHILGIDIERKLEQMDRNWEGVITKIRRFCKFWWNFELSILGRVMLLNVYNICP